MSTHRKGWAVPGVHETSSNFRYLDGFAGNAGKPEVNPCEILPDCTLPVTRMDSCRSRTKGDHARDEE